jgi:hypothetical protein
MLRDRLERQYAAAEDIPAVETLREPVHEHPRPVMEGQRGDVNYHFDVAEEPKK